MKKLIMILVAALTLSSVATAQSMKVDVEGLKKKTAASDADIQDPKKGAKAATWMNRGKAYFDAAVAPTSGLRRGMDANTELKIFFGNPQSEKSEEVLGQPYTVLVYPHFDVYVADGAVAFWRQKTTIVADGLDTSVAAYEKAAEIDPKQAPKAKANIEAVINQFRQDGDVAFPLGEYAFAAKAFAKAYDYSMTPLVNQPDSMSAYNAGYVSVLAEDFDTALKYLLEAQKLGYDGDGEVYFLLSYVYTEKDRLEDAENILKEGIRKYPANSRLIQSLIVHYTSTGQDATQIIPMVEEALKNDPGNYIFHFGLGLIYDKLEDFDKSIEEFAKASELNPQDFNSAINLGIAYVRKAEAMLPVINEIPVNERARYDEMLEQLSATYKASLAPLEHAYSLNPQESQTVDLLKSIYFRFRDESPEMMQKYEKYDELLKAMQQ